MAKQPETQDRFRLYFDTSREMMGVAIAELARAGITNVQYELITDILAFQTKNAPRVFDTNAMDIARTFIKQHHSFKARELTTAFEQEGRSQSNGFSVIKKLVQLNELRSLGGGHYQSTEVKVLAAPTEPIESPTAEPVEPNSRAPKRYEISNLILVLNAIERRKQITRAELAQVLIDNGRPKKSIDGVLGKLKEGGRIKSVSEGVYEVIKQPAKGRRHG